jgi:S1-C subfamily serine protease
VSYIAAIILLLLVVQPAAADFAAAEAAEQRGDFAAANQACKTDAEAGDAQCQNYLGVLSELGRGTSRDATAAARLFHLAAMQGLAAAQYNLGRHYAAGLGVHKDPAEAARWYRMAAEQSNPAAQNALAILVATGRGVSRDPEAAIGLFRRAATSGYGLAQLNLAVAFERGRLMAHDPLRAFIWYSIAARPGSDQTLREQAAQARDRLAQKIPLPQIEAARIAARSWAPGRPDPDEGMVPPPRRLARRSREGERLSSGGSGFIVSRSGDVLTNHHVIDGCRELQVMRNEKPVVATLVATDPADDLAILRLPEPVADAAPLRGDIPVKPGEAVVVVGFPLQGLLSSQASVTAGIVSRLAGPHDDTHLLQITAPVQPGNSGSPLLDANGAVAGIVVAKLNGLRIVRRTGTIPENINFAVNAKYARALLDRSGVPYQTASADETLSTPAIAERALKFTVLVQCFK